MPLFPSGTLTSLIPAGRATWLGWAMRFLECIGDYSFLIEVVDGPVRGDTQLDLLITATEGLVGDAMIMGMPGSTYHDIAETWQASSKGAERTGQCHSHSHNHLWKSPEIRRGPCWLANDKYIAPILKKARRMIWGTAGQSASLLCWLWLG